MKTSSGRARKGKSAKRAKETTKKFELPKAFHLVATKVAARRRPHRHVLGAEGMTPPCPPGSVYSGRIKVGDTWFCVYVSAEGPPLMIAC